MRQYIESPNRACVCVCVFQVRSLTCVWCAAKRSVRAQIWSHTAENTALIIPSAVLTVRSASRGDWSYSDTYRHTLTTTTTTPAAAAAADNTCITGPERNHHIIHYTQYLSLYDVLLEQMSNKRILWIFSKSVTMNSNIAVCINNCDIIKFPRWSDLTSESYTISHFR